MTWHLLCLVGTHEDQREHAEAGVLYLRCQRCGRRTPGWDLRDVMAPTLRFAGHLTASEVRRILRRGKQSRPPVYVDPAVTAQIQAADAAARARKTRGPATVTNIRRSA